MRQRRAEVLGLGLLTAIPTAAMPADVSHSCCIPSKAVPPLQPGPPSCLTVYNSYVVSNGDCRKGQIKKSSAHPSAASHRCTSCGPQQPSNQRGSSGLHHLVSEYGTTRAALPARADSLKLKHAPAASAALSLSWPCSQAATFTPTHKTLHHRHHARCGVCFQRPAKTVHSTHLQRCSRHAVGPPRLADLENFARGESD